jgi:inositol-hexakisphosphate/diphosphoinositol-pentakisphosphate 1-kinase
MDSLVRTTSTESSRSTSHPLTSTPYHSPPSLKGRSAAPDTTSGNVERADISMPPPASQSIARRYSITSQMASQASGSPEVSNPLLSSDNAPKVCTSNSAVDDTDTTPTLEGTQANNINAAGPVLPEAAIQAPRVETDIDSHRMSFSSLYSFGSAIYNGIQGRPPVSGPSSVAGSEPEGERIFPYALNLAVRECIC